MKIVHVAIFIDSPLSVM